MMANDKKNEKSTSDEKSNKSTTHVPTDSEITDAINER